MDRMTRAVEEVERAVGDMELVQRIDVRAARWTLALADSRRADDRIDCVIQGPVELERNFAGGDEQCG
jgi:hypothetical protein